MRKLSSAMTQHLGKLAKRALEAKVKNDGRPFVLLHLITNRCMCQCASCLWKHNDWEEVPTAELKRFYREAKAEGFVATALSGGEPFLRQDLGELTRFIKEEAGMPILLFTTGWFLEARMDEVLPHIAILMLSLDSARAERHNEIRGLPGLFERLVRGVKLVKEKYPELSVQFNTCVQKGIADEIDDLIKLAQDLDVQISFDVITDFRHGADGSHFSETNRGLPLAELRGVSAYLLERKRAGAPILNSEMYFKYFADGKPGYKCHFPKMCMSLDGRGNVEYCLDLDHNLANLRETPLKEIMELPRFKQLRQDAELCSSCSSPTMIDMSQVWENPKLLFEQGGIALG